MYNVAFATCRNWQQLSEDDQLVSEILRREKVRVSAAIWDAPDIDWSGFDAVVIRSTWDYHHKAGEYAEWVRRFAGGRPRLWNRPEVVLQNMNKRYLGALAAKGVKTVPTAYFSAAQNVLLRDVLAEHDWQDAVVKPAVSAAAHETWRTCLERAEIDQGRFAEQIRRRDLLIQPYVPEIGSKGEWSFVFLGGSFSHAVLKRPADGDFRVQREFGGTTVHAKPEPALIAQAESMMSAVGDELLYARVDGIERGGELILMELEMIEPFLFLGFSEGAPHRFAETIIGALRRDRQG